MTTHLGHRLLGIGNMSRMGVDHDSCRPRCRMSFSHRGLTLRKLGLTATNGCLHGHVGNTVTSGCHRSKSRCSVGIHCTPRCHADVRDVRGVLVCGDHNRTMHIGRLNGIIRHFTPPAVRHGSHRHVIAISTIVSNRTLNGMIGTNGTVVSGVSVPSGMAVRMTNSCRSRRSSFHSLNALTVLVIMLIFVIVTTRFRSLACPFVVVFSLPFTFDKILVTLFFAGDALDMVDLLKTVVLVNVIMGGNVMLVSCVALYHRHKLTILGSIMATNGDHLHPMLVAATAAILNVVPVTVNNKRNSRV